MRTCRHAISAALAALSIAGCGGGSIAAAPPPAPPPAGPPPQPTASPWAEVETAFDRAYAATGYTGAALAIYAPDGRLLYSRVRGDLALDRRVAVASASKLVSGLTLLRLVDQGLLSLDSTTGDVLGWVGPRAAVTLRHMLSFTSGLPTVFTPGGGGTDCTRDATVTLAACVDEIGRGGLGWPVGSRFEYGNTHLHVAARMAEVVAGVGWDAIVGQQLRAPFGWSAEAAYYTAPRQAVGTLNPLVAGGLRASMDEYAKLLGVVHNRGTHEGQRLIAAPLVEQIGRDPYPHAVTGFTPVAATGLEYGLTAWLECDTPTTGCDVLSSAGAFGFMPWIDRGGGYYAIIGLEESGDAAGFSMRLAVELRPLIRAALGG